MRKLIIFLLTFALGCQASDYNEHSAAATCREGEECPKPEPPTVVAQFEAALRFAEGYCSCEVPDDIQFIKACTWDMATGSLCAGACTELIDVSNTDYQYCLEATAAPDCKGIPLECWRLTGWDI